MSSELEVRVETVKKLDVKRGDVLHVRLGLTAEELGEDGSAGPWIPSKRELEEARAVWTQVLPAGVGVIVSHIGMEVVEVKQE